MGPQRPFEPIVTQECSIVRVDDNPEPVLTIADAARTTNGFRPSFVVWRR